MASYWSLWNTSNKAKGSPPYPGYGRMLSRYYQVGPCTKTWQFSLKTPIPAILLCAGKRKSLRGGRGCPQRANQTPPSQLILKSCWQPPAPPYWHLMHPDKEAAYQDALDWGKWMGSDQPCGYETESWPGTPSHKASKPYTQGLHMSPICQLQWWT